VLERAIGRALDVPRSVALFAVAAVAEIGGAWLIWQAVRAGPALDLIGATVCLVASR
jgi:small multidrug resistance family-3 protein